MALAFTHLSWWLPSGKHKEPRISNGSSANSVSDAGVESDNLKFPLAKSRAVSSSRNVKRKWRSREERKIDREYDIVLVPPDGGCISGSESDDLEWSIGWLEPHGPGFQSDDDSDDSFAVLVPCYGKVHDYLIEDSESKIVGAVAHITEIYPAEREVYETVAVYPPKQLICTEKFQVTMISMCCGYKSGGRAGPASSDCNDPYMEGL